MSNQGQPIGAEIITFPPRVASTKPDADIASMIEVLQDQLAMAREESCARWPSCPSPQMARPSARSGLARVPMSLASLVS